MFTLEDTIFFGSTFWTSLKNNDPLISITIKTSMNDYNCVTEKNGHNYHKLTTSTTYSEYMSSVITLKNVEEYAKSNNFKLVVLGHHAPSMKSIHPKFSNQTMLNYGYCNELDEWIMDTNIVLWTHGHVHSSWDYMIGNTRIFANPHGYGSENKEFDPYLIVEI